MFIKRRTLNINIENLVGKKFSTCEDIASKIEQLTGYKAKVFESEFESEGEYDDGYAADYVLDYDILLDTKLLLILLINEVDDDGIILK